MAHERFAVLDGWRGISILAVLACHLLPLGPKSWQLNASAAVFGMSLFFSLSGFLICRQLLRGTTTTEFLIRRICRIVPLAWLGLIVGLWMQHAPETMWLPHFAFYANYEPFWRLPLTDHYWSLCVEMQFYIAIAAMYGIAGRGGLLIAVPVGALVLTALTVAGGDPASPFTHLRGNEILCGALLAIIYEGCWSERIRRALGSVHPLSLFALFAISTLAL